MDVEPNRLLVGGGWPWRDTDPDECPHRCEEPLPSGCTPVEAARVLGRVVSVMPSIRVAGFALHPER
eukprot:11185738-Lingulodinium_polyedra.AAC.1